MTTQIHTKDVSCQEEKVKIFNESLAYVKANKSTYVVAGFYAFALIVTVIAISFVDYFN